MRMAVLVSAALSINTQLAAQQYRPNPLPGEERSSNVRVVGHLAPLNASGPYNVSDIELEQELSRPYVYLDRANEAGRPNPTIGFDIISLKDVSRPQIIYSWRIDNPELHRGPGSLAPTYIKTHGRYFFFNGFQFQAGGHSRTPVRTLGQRKG